MRVSYRLDAISHIMKLSALDASYSTSSSAHATKESQINVDAMGSIMHGQCKAVMARVYFIPVPEAPTSAYISFKTIDDFKQGDRIEDDVHHGWRRWRRLRL